MTAIWTVGGMGSFSLDCERDGGLQSGLREGWRPAVWTAGGMEACNLDLVSLTECLGHLSEKAKLKINKNIDTF